MKRHRQGKVSVAFLVLAVLALVGVPAGFLGFKATQKNKRSAEVLPDGPNVYSSFRERDEHSAYLEWVVDRAHPVAFGKGYSTGGLFKPAEFDERAYYRALADEMVRIMREADDAQRRELAERLSDYFEAGNGYLD